MGLGLQHKSFEEGHDSVHNNWTLTQAISLWDVLGHFMTLGHCIRGQRLNFPEKEPFFVVYRWDRLFFLFIWIYLTKSLQLHVCSDKHGN